MKKLFDIKVGAIKYTVYYDFETLGYYESHGVTDHFQDTIRIYPKGSKAKRQEVLVHELLHACMQQAGLNYMLDKEKRQMNSEEIVYCLAPILTQVLTDNKNLLEKLN